MRLAGRMCEPLVGRLQAQITSREFAEWCVAEDEGYLDEVPFEIRQQVLKEREKKPQTPEQMWDILSSIIQPQNMKREGDDGNSR